MRQSINLKIKAASKSGGNPELYIYDEIGPEWAGMISGGMVVDALHSLGDSKSIDVHINSPGGDTFEGIAIHNALAGFRGKVHVYVDALAASAASLIAMAGSTISMAENSMIMIHNCWTVACGNKTELGKQAGVMNQIDGEMAKMYAKRSGLSVAKIVSLMNAETWMTSSEAKAQGFCDSIDKPSTSAKAATPAWYPATWRAKLAEIERKQDQTRDLLLLGSAERAHQHIEAGERIAERAKHN